MLFHHFQVLLFGEQLCSLKIADHARIANNIGFKIEHTLNITQRHVEHHTETGWQGLEEPNVGCRRGQFNVPHAVATNLSQRHFDATLLADHATMLEALVLAAQALVILDRAKNLGTKQAITLRLEGAVVDGFRLLYFAVGPGTDLLGRSETNGNRVKFLFRRYLLE